ncbi:hypothetical protein PTTW11_05142 [Pyrenophora teres f. teres]|uniref:Uncharacterized protein n=1 Tax=Pyrenophora teres f. teres TaxID=97479 RepID=A0A6S6W4A1_9PLEO|nr:hypothetical protein PTTW11_05142 [Pyrenophora teres f. teres]
MRFTIVTLLAIIAPLIAAKAPYYPPGLPNGCTDTDSACDKGTASVCSYICVSGSGLDDPNNHALQHSNVLTGKCINYPAAQQKRYKKNGYCSP